MFQPQPTPFASSFHAQSPLSQSHSHSRAHAHSSRGQQHVSQNVGGYRMGMGGAATGGLIGLVGGARGGMPAATAASAAAATSGGGADAADIPNYITNGFPATSNPLGVASPTGANCIGMGMGNNPLAQGHHGHGHSHGHIEGALNSGLEELGMSNMGVGMGGMGMDVGLSMGSGVDMVMDMGMGVGVGVGVGVGGVVGMSQNCDLSSLGSSPVAQSQQSSRSQSLSLAAGGEPAGAGAASGAVAGAGAGAGAVAPAAAAVAAPSAPSTSHATTPGSGHSVSVSVRGPGAGRCGPPLGLPPAARPPVATAITASMPAGNGLQVYSSSSSSSRSPSSPLAATAAPCSSGLPAASDVPFQHQQHHYQNSPSASSTDTTSSSHSHSYSNAHAYAHPRPHTRVTHRHQAGAPSSSTTTTTNTSLSFYNFNSSSNSNNADAASTVPSASTRPSTMEPGDPSDLAAQEAAARDYQPQLEGPLVGDRITSDAITDEYAKADDVYVAKTLNLPQTYSHYRPIQGDGNCGWRAIGFSYFEHLVNNGDHQQLLGEVARITSFNSYLLNIGGYDRMLFEDMVDETIALLRDLAQSISNPHMAMQILVARFNDVDASNAIIYHLRLLASSWLKGNADVYEPFISGETGLAGYAAEIERPNREIEHLGIMLLVEVLLKPVNFVLEIAYLDRSAGNQVNTYRFPNEANGQDPASLGPIIYLLYRPDHYDILYKSPPNPAPLNLQVHRATTFSHRQEIAGVTQSLHNFANVDYSPLAMLPGFGGPPSGLSSALSSLGSPTSTSPLPDAYDPSPQSPWLATPYSDHLQQQQQQQQPVSAPRPQPQAPSQSQSAPASGKPSQPVDYQLRFSHQCWHLSNANSAQPSILSGQSGFQEPNFTTAMFKNSHFNKAHYQNPHFHPEEWTPDDDVHERAPSIKKKGRIKSEH